MTSPPLIKYICTVFMAMVPVVELRGAIPYGISAGIEPWLAFGLAVFGNILPAPLLIIYIRKIFSFLRTRIPLTDRFISWLEKRGAEKGELVKRYRFLGIVILVAIPLPGTGAWTGALVSALLDVRMKRSLPAILLGVIIAGLIVLLPAAHLFG